MSWLFDGYWFPMTLLFGSTFVLLAIRIVRSRQSFRAGTLSPARAIIAVRQRAGLPIVFGIALVILALPMFPWNDMMAAFQLRGNVSIEPTGVDRLVFVIDGAIGILVGAGFYGFTGRLFTDGRGPDASSGQRVSP